MKIGELANLTGFQVDTIRFYERIGVMPACARTEGNYRIYSRQHIEVLRFIKSCKSLNMPLDEIRTLVALRQTQSSNCAEVNSIIDNHLAGVQKQLAELSSLQEQLADLKKCCHANMDRDGCGIIKELSAAASVAAAQTADTSR